MEDFIKKLAEIYGKAKETAKGTGQNMMRGLDGTAMEEMRQSDRARNAKLIEESYPGGMRGYMRDNGMMTEADVAALEGRATTTPAFGNQMQPQVYSNTIRQLLNKP